MKSNTADDRHTRAAERAKSAVQRICNSVSWINFETTDSLNLLRAIICSVEGGSPLESLL